MGRGTRGAGEPIARVDGFDLSTTSGYLVADKAGRIMGRVEAPIYGRRMGLADALTVRGERFLRQRRLVPAEVIEQIDGVRGLVALRVERKQVRSFR